MKRPGALTVFLLLGCAPSHGAAYEHAMAEASRAEGAGRLAEAEQAYGRAQGAAQRPRDRDQARWDAADVLAREGQIAQALARFEAIAADGSSDHQAEATYRVALLRIDHGDADRGWRALEQVPRRFPTHGIAHVAVRRLVAHADEQGARAAIDELRLLERDLGATELAPLVAFLAAEHVEAAGDDAAARDAYLRIAARWPYPFGAFFDDALWHASLLDEKLGRPEAAVQDLERLVSVRETTTLMGSYERARYVPAMLRIAELYRDRLHDRSRARDAYHRLYTDYVHSTKRDEALWLEASLWREDGDAPTACDRLGTLVHDFPDSRYVPCATQECPGLARPTGSESPGDCHAYLTRRASDAGAREADED